MRIRMAVPSAFLAAVLLAPAAASGLSDEIPTGIGWVNDWDKALVTAAERGVPLIISFANDQ